MLNYPSIVLGFGPEAASLAHDNPWFADALRDGKAVFRTWLSLHLGRILSFSTNGMDSRSKWNAYVHEHLTIMTRGTRITAHIAPIRDSTFQNTYSSRDE